jgi:hypothetical protein
MGVTEPKPQLTHLRWLSVDGVKAVAAEAAGRVTETVTPLLLPLYTRVLRVQKRIRGK